MIKDVQSGKLTKVLTTEYDTDFSTALNNCSAIGLGDIIEAMGKRVLIHDAFDRLEYLRETKEYKVLIERWVDISTYSSIYKKLNESNYVDTEYSYKSYLGHADDDTDEMIASITDAALSYPTKFKEVIDSMDDEERAATLTAVHASFQLIGKRHQSLRAYLQTLEHRLHA
jgi:hypothetical protein